MKSGGAVFLLGLGMDTFGGERPKLTQIPPTIAAAADYERAAADFLDAATYEHVCGGAGAEQSLRANLAAFEAVSVYNRVFADCTPGTTEISLLGRRYRHPIFLAPVAQQGLAHPGAESATAQAAAALEACMTVSTLSSQSMEDIAAAADGEKWFQLYFQRERALTLALARRAEAAGYVALVVTADAPVQPLSRRAARAGFKARGVQANLVDQPPPAPLALSPAQSVIFQGMMAEAPTWDDLVWLIGETKLPVIVKGVSHPDDAERCLTAGAAGIIVSNHGGRALDGAPATLSALPALRERVGQRGVVLLDGGVRSGYDVFKALALGADAVMIGRPQVFALAVAGALGVAHMLRMMRDELELCMALAGRPVVHCITPSALFPAPGKS